jgi:hypothetical protein
MFYINSFQIKKYYYECTMLLNKKLQISHLNKYRQTQPAGATLFLSSIHASISISSNSAAPIKLANKLLTNSLKLLAQSVRKSQARGFQFVKKSKFVNNLKTDYATKFNQSKITIDIKAFVRHVNFKFNLVRRELNDRSQLFLRNCIALFRNVQFHTKPSLANLGRASLTASVGIFNWDEHKITNEEVNKEVSDILTLFGIESEKQTSPDDQRTSKKIDFEASRKIETDEWKKIYNEKDLIIWRRSVNISEDMDDPNSESYDLFEYKVLGRMNDITPLDYFQTQIDLSYRKVWDHLVISLKTVETDENTKSELIRWVTHFPYPLYPREYIYVRRYCLEPNERLLILVARSVPDTVYKPQTDKNAKNKQENLCVRVNNYKSNLIVIPHTDYDKVGLDYIIQYYDINKAKIPKVAFKWMTSSGLPDYMSKTFLISINQGSFSSLF